MPNTQASADTTTQRKRGRPKGSAKKSTTRNTSKRVSTREKNIDGEGNIVAPFLPVVEENIVRNDNDVNNVPDEDDDDDDNEAEYRVSNIDLFDVEELAFIGETRDGTLEEDLADANMKRMRADCVGESSRSAYESGRSTFLIWLCNSRHKEYMSKRWLSEIESGTENLTGTGRTKYIKGIVKRKIQNIDMSDLPLKFESFNPEIFVNTFLA